jgi:hypothetical protein
MTKIEFFNRVSLIPVLVGWVFFFMYLSVRLSGAKIYATTEDSIIEKIDPVWKEATKNTELEGGGFKFHMEINK